MKLNHRDVLNRLVALASMGIWLETQLQTPLSLYPIQETLITSPGDGVGEYDVPQISPVVLISLELLDA